MTTEDERLSHLELAQGIARKVCRRHHCPVDETEDFVSAVTLRLIEDDYAVLRKFQGQSTLATYLTTVVNRMFLDLRNREWGKWRPSATARRLGPLALKLERLLRRDGRAFEEAVTMLGGHPGDTTPLTELERIERLLPLKVRRMRVDEEALVDVPAPDSRPDRPLQDAERSELRERAIEALVVALDELPAEDRLIVKLRVLDHCQMPAIGRMLNADPKRLYRRFEAIRLGLRDRLERERIDATVLGELLDEEGFEPRGGLWS